MKLKAIADHVLATDGDFEDQVTEAGIILKSTVGKSEGIVPRWFHIVAVGPEVHHVKADDWVLVEHGRWTEQIEIDGMKLWRVEADSCLAVSDEKPADVINIADSRGNTAFAEKKTR